MQDFQEPVQTAHLGKSLPPHTESPLEPIKQLSFPHYILQANKEARPFLVCPSHSLGLAPQIPPVAEPVEKSRVSRLGGPTLQTTCVLKWEPKEGRKEASLQLLFTALKVPVSLSTF